MIDRHVCTAPEDLAQGQTVRLWVLNELVRRLEFIVSNKGGCNGAGEWGTDPFLCTVGNLFKSTPGQVRPETGNQLLALWWPTGHKCGGFNLHAWQNTSCRPCMLANQPPVGGLSRDASHGTVSGPECLSHPRRRVPLRQDWGACMGQRRPAPLGLSVRHLALA